MSSRDQVKSIIGDYKYGFKTNAKTVASTGKGLTLDVVKEISRLKGEPEWMLDYRIKAYHEFMARPLPSFGPDLSFIDYNDYTYYIKSSKDVANKWEDVPEEIKETFDKIGIPEAERKFLAGVSTQFESEAVYHSTIQELEEKGV